MLRKGVCLSFGTVSCKNQGLSFNFFRSQSGALTVPVQKGHSFPGPCLSHYIFWHCRQKRVLRRKKEKKVTNEYINPFFPAAVAHWLLIHDGEQETSESRGHADDVCAHFQILPLKIHS